MNNEQLRSRPIPPKCISEFCAKVEPTIGYPGKSIELLYTRNINKNSYLDFIWTLFTSMLKHIREWDQQSLTNIGNRDAASGAPSDMISVITKLKTACLNSGTTILNVAHFLLVNDKLSIDTQADKIGDIIKEKYPNCKIMDSSAWSKVKSALEKCGLEFTKRQPMHRRSTYKLVTIPAIWRQAAEKIVQESRPP